jgi:hypothetical protein
MTINNLNFFDKFGKNINLDWNSDTEIWQGTIYFPEVSTYLYDNENIFILEKVGSDYKFPVLNPGESLIIQWKDNEIENELFLYEVEKDYDLNNYFINKKDSISVSYDDLIPASGGNSINISLPLQLNIAFNPTEEIKYERTLYIFKKDDTSPTLKTKIAEINFYGEGLDEDERFGVWARNFGIRFNKEDANILKDYDIKEAFPNWADLNLARKTLLVNKEHVYPYIGTYKGLVNFVNLMGYKDVLKIKEYWNNVNTKSPYFNKQSLVDITDYLDDGTIDEMNILDKNKSIKFGKQFKKTECLALIYQFTKASDTYDDDGIPIIEETTTFTVNEMFYKLNKLSEKLKNEFIPVNVKIKDVIGEFIYFQKLTIKFWKDDIKIFDYDLNEQSEVQVYPDANVDFVIRNLNPLYRLKEINGSFTDQQLTLNNGFSNPYEDNQKYKPNQIQGIIDYIKSFYNEIKNQRFHDIGARLSWQDGDDWEAKIGAPAVFNVKLDKFTFENFRGVTFEDLQGNGGFDPFFTLGNLDFRNFHEITWRITKDAPLPYNFVFRGPIETYYQLPHFLPYTGEYRVTAELHDFYGNTSVFSKKITVQSDQVLHVVATTRLEDKFDYTLSNLNNVRLQDFGASPNYFPRINVLDHDTEIGEIDVDKNLQQWTAYYLNGYGTGVNMYDVEIWDSSSKKWVLYTDPIQKHPKLNYWGLGSDDVPMKLEDLEDMQLKSLYFLRLSDLIWQGDFNAGFYIRDPKPGQTIKISLFSDYIIPEFESLEDLVEQLNSSTHQGIKLFNYEIIDGKKSDNQYIIHAQAEFFGKEMYHILTEDGSSPASPTNSSPNGGAANMDKYTFFLPRKVYSERLINYLKSISPIFDDETLFLNAKTSDLLTGAVQDPSFWVNEKYWKFEEDKQTGYLPTIMDQNAFNMNDIKVFESDFVIPENGIVYFNVNNIDGKDQFVWSLYDYYTREEIIRVRNVPYFIWKFKDLGRYSIKVDIIDNKGNVYSRQVDHMINVLDKNQYIQNIETRLNRRKLNL